jgi:hypothetical protein
MNRHERRAQVKQGGNEGPAADEKTSPQGRPSLGLRVFSRILLSNWVVSRVHQPDLVAILMQIAQQVGRTDAIARLALKSYGQQR